MRIGTCNICEARNVPLRYTACHGIETWVCDEGCNQPDQGSMYELVAEETGYYTNPLAPEKSNPWNNVHKGYVR